MQLRQIPRAFYTALFAVLFVFATGCSTGLGTQPQPDVDRTPPPPAEDDFEREEDFEDDILTDNEIHDRVHDALDRAPSLDASDIHVSVENGTVRLWGTVHSEQERQTAHDVAHSVRGVDRVFFDDLRVHG